MIRLRLLFVCVIPFALLSVVHDSQTIRVLLDHAACDVCIICDLDNTLVRPVGILGSDEWFSDFLTHDDSQIFSEHLRRLVHFFEAVHHRVPLVRLEEDTPDVLLLCADQGARIIAMTARSSRLQERTAQQLRALSIDFSPLSQLLDQDLGNDKSVYAGIVFCNGGNKAEMFKRLVDDENYRPSMLIVIDDRREYLEQFRMLCMKWGVPCMLYHYRRAEQYKEMYTRAHAVQELEQFVVKHPEFAEVALIICAAFGMVEFSHSY